MSKEHHSRSYLSNFLANHVLVSILALTKDENQRVVSGSFDANPVCLLALKTASWAHNLSGKN